MIKDERNYLRGFMLLPPSSVLYYLGVDRNPFQPILLSEEMIPSAQVSEEYSHVWQFYPPGWRRDAYRLYEENLAEGSEESLLYLLSSLVAARKIQRVIEPHIDTHEIVWCEVSDLDSVTIQQGANEIGFLGYDVAYPGGDFYSAVLNGLFINPHPILVSEYKQLLNKVGLFSEIAPIPKYIQRFREFVPSEAESKFSVFRLTLMFWCGYNF